MWHLHHGFLSSFWMCQIYPLQQPSSWTGTRAECHYVLSSFVHKQVHSNIWIATFCGTDVCLPSFYDPLKIDARFKTLIHHENLHISLPCCMAPLCGQKLMWQNTNKGDTVSPQMNASGLKTGAHMNASLVEPMVQLWLNKIHQFVIMFSTKMFSLGCAILSDTPKYNFVDDVSHDFPWYFYIPPTSIFPPFSHHIPSIQVYQLFPTLPMISHEIFQKSIPMTFWFTLWLCQNSYGKSQFLMGKSTISMAVFNSYVSLPEGTL